MSEFGELARGLLSLEVNTIQKDGMSGRKMPAAPSALIEVAQTYWNFLCLRATAFGLSDAPLDGWAAVLSNSFRWGREPFKQPDGAGDRRVDHPETEPQPAGHRADFLRQGPLDVSLDDFDDLREVASWMAEMQLRAIALASGQGGSYAGLRAKISDAEFADLRATARRFKSEDRSILLRIKSNCDLFKQIVKRLGSQPITRDTSNAGFQSGELVQIRKAWDIGVEVILIQTVIQLDGDVVNRFQPGMDTPDAAPVRDLHASAVDISFRYWKTLIDTVASVAGSAFKTLVSG